MTRPLKCVSTHLATDSLVIAVSSFATLCCHVIGLCCSFFAKLLLSQYFFSVRYTMKFLQALPLAKDRVGCLLSQFLATLESELVLCLGCLEVSLCFLHAAIFQNSYF